MTFRWVRESLNSSKVTTTTGVVLFHARGINYRVTSYYQPQCYISCIFVLDLGQWPREQPPFSWWGQWHNQSQTKERTKSATAGEIRRLQLLMRFYLLSAAFVYTLILILDGPRMRLVANIWSVDSQPKCSSFQLFCFLLVTDKREQEVSIKRWARTRSKIIENKK